MEMGKRMLKVFVYGVTICLFMVSGPMAYCQDVLFEDDFSGDLSNWQEQGNTGIAVIEEEHVLLEWGHAPHWFVTNDTFDFGSQGYQFDITFVNGGHQQTENYRTSLMQPLLGATDPETENGAVRTTFNYLEFNMQRWSENADGELVWQGIEMKSDEAGVSIEPGVRITVEINPDGLTGRYLVNGQELSSFIYNGDPLTGGFGFRSVVQRNLIVDNVRFYQIDESGNETVILEDDFNRSELGDDWVNETLAADTTPGPLSTTIQDGQLYIENDGSADTWVRTAEEVEFEGSTTVFEFDFVDYLGDVVYNPTVIAGTKPYVSGETSGVMLMDNGAGFNYAMQNGGWSGGQAVALGGVRPGMRFRVEIDPGAQSGRSYRDDVEVADWFSLGAPLSGGFAFRSIVNRDAVIDDVRIYTIDEAGNETTVFEDDFNRSQVGNNWVVESITPGGLVEALIADVADDDGDGDNELVLDHDETLEDNWCRLDMELPYGEDTLVIEGTYVAIPNGYPSIVIGTEEWVENETIGPLLLDNIASPWGMDTREGNVWVQNGPIGGTKVSIIVNEDGRSGAFLTNDVTVQEWEFADGEDPIPAGSVGINDPYSSVQENVFPAFDPVAVARYDDIRVLSVAPTSIDTWMLH